MCVVSLFINSQRTKREINKRSVHMTGKMLYQEESDFSFIYFVVLNRKIIFHGRKSTEY